MSPLLQHLKPTEAEVRALALCETDPAQVARFEPIAHGPLFALLALVAVVLSALPSCALRLLRGALQGARRDG